jgi:hypothetical protein
MPYIQPKTNNYFGFMPVSMSGGGTIECNPYLVSSSEGNAINIGDVVVQTSINTVRVITGAFNPTSSMAVVGVAASPLAANAGSTGALMNQNTSQMVLVYDSPNQRFVVCDTTSASAGTQTALYKNYAVLATGCIGSTGPNTSLNRSVQALSGVTSTALGGFHIIALHPIENGQYSSGGAGTAVTSSGVSKWIGVFTAAVTLQGLSSANLNTIANTTS